MDEVLRRHATLVRQSIEGHGGYVFKTVGDAFCAAFPTASEALISAVEIQRQIKETEWGETPIKVRMGVRSGSAEEREGDYFGRTINRAARLESAGSRIWTGRNISLKSRLPV